MGSCIFDGSTTSRSSMSRMTRSNPRPTSGTTNGVQEGSVVISDDPEYNPKEDEVVVHKTLKVQTLSCLEGSGSCTEDSQQEEEELRSICCNASRKGDGPTSRTKKRILEPDEPDRVTRQKATTAAATDHQESPLGMDFEILVEMRDEFL
ncbi:hypothetical protein D1007_08734 [Hordeum vulgare]|nr:hypothetical protein D1007_08734 [Hordeum vulgare]